MKGDPTLKLSQKQQQIVSHKDGALLVEAGPGSGKTRVLIERIKFLLSSTRACLKNKSCTKGANMRN